MVNVAGAVIAQKVVEIMKSLRQVAVAFSINDIDPFVGMGVVEPQSVLARRRHSRNRGVGWRHQRCQEQQCNARNPVFHSNSRIGPTPQEHSLGVQGILRTAGHKLLLSQKDPALHSYLSAGLRRRQVRAASG